MVRRQQLSEERIAELFDPPTEQRELVRHFTLSAADLAAIQRCRGDANRPGYALMLCYLRHPGRALRTGERPPVALLAFVAEQISVLPEAIDEYLASERNRQRHAVECQEQLGLRPFGRHAAAELANSLLPHAIASTTPMSSLKTICAKSTSRIRPTRCAPRFSASMQRC